MKRGVIALFAAVMICLASCHRQKGQFILHGTVQAGGDDTIIVVGIDSRFDHTDTISYSGGRFKWSFKPDTVTTLILLLPDGRQFPVFAEKDVESTLYIPSDTGKFILSGGYCNDSFQSFYEVSLSDTSMEQTAVRIDSFITRDPFSEVTPYLIYNYMVKENHAEQSKIEALIKRMSGNMQDAPYLTNLKNEFAKELSNNIYLDKTTVFDSTGTQYQFQNIGGSTNDLLVLVWSSWNGDIALQTRAKLEYFLDKYSQRKLIVTDISIDPNRERWKGLIAKDSVRWISYNDPDGWNSKFITSTNTKSLPVFILFSGVKKLQYKTDSFVQIDTELDRVLPEPQPDKNQTNNQAPKKLRMRFD